MISSTKSRSQGAPPDRNRGRGSGIGISTTTSRAWWTLPVCLLIWYLWLRAGNAYIEKNIINIFNKTVWFRFGSVSVFSICYRPGSVYVRFWFLRFVVVFGLVFGMFLLNLKENYFF